VSWGTIRWVQQHAPVRGSEYCVLLALALRLGRNEKAWPSMRRLALDTRLNKSTVYRAVRRLEEGGLIEVRRQVGKVSAYMVMTKAVYAPRDPHCTPGATPSVRGVSTEQPREATKLKQPPAIEIAEVRDLKAEDIISSLKKETEPVSDRAMVDKLDAMAQSLGNATRVWRVMHARWCQGYLPEFTQKEMGQLKLFMQRAPEGRALALIGIVIRHWEMFPKPKRMHFPHIGFLLTKIAEADQLMFEVLRRDEETDGPQELEVGEW